MERGLLAVVAVLAVVVDVAMRRGALWRREAQRERAERIERDCEAYRAGYAAGYRDAARQRPSSPHSTEPPRRER